jgi:hypothetical protein
VPLRLEKVEERLAYLGAGHVLCLAEAGKQHAQAELSSTDRADYPGCREWGT